MAGRSRRSSQWGDCRAWSKGTRTTCSGSTRSRSANVCGSSPPPHRPAEVGGDDEGPARELLTAVAVGVQGGGHQVVEVAQGDRVGEAAGDEQALQDVEGALPSVRARPKISVSLGGCASGAAASAIGVMASQGGESWSPVASSTGAYWPCSRPSAWLHRDEPGFDGGQVRARHPQHSLLAPGRRRPGRRACAARADGRAARTPDAVRGVLGGRVPVVGAGVGAGGAPRFRTIPRVTLPRMRGREPGPGLPRVRGRARPGSSSR